MSRLRACACVCVCVCVSEGVFDLLRCHLLSTSAPVPSPPLTHGNSEWAARASIPKHVVDLIASFPEAVHPMSQFTSAICALQTESKFAKQYAAGMNKVSVIVFRRTCQCYLLCPLYLFGVGQ